MPAEAPPDLTRKRCFFHTGREAVAVCLKCGQYFCRECITEHDGRVLCAGCLPDAGSERKKKNRFALLGKFLLFFGAVVLLWLSFYYLGQLLLTLPASFHEGSLWKELWQQR